MGCLVVNILIYLCLIFVLLYWMGSPHFLPSNLLIIRKSPGEELEGWLKKFSWNNRQDLKEPAQLPKYKFYTEVVEVLLGLARKMGGNYQDAMLFLREGLQIDRQFEKKISEAILGIWVQMAFMMLLTWAFIIGALSFVEVKIALKNLVLIGVWQGLGLSSLPFLLSWLRRRYFADIGKIWKMLFVLKSLVKVPLSRTEILTLAGIQELVHIRQVSLLPLVAKLKETCQKTLKVGTSYEEDVNYLMDELRFQEKWHFELFEKKLVLIKLGLMALFFLPSYLAFIFLLLSDLMALM